MARLTADLSDVKEIQPLEEDVYIGHIKSFEKVMTKGMGENKNKNPMLVLTWEVECLKSRPDDNQFRGRLLKYDNVILGGLNAKGEGISPFRLVNLLDCARIPWECEECHNGEAEREFLRGTLDNGLAVGKLHCPDCNSSNLHIGFDDDNLVGHRSGLKIVKKKPEGKDFFRNEIASYLPAD